MSGLFRSINDDGRLSRLSVASLDRNFFELSALDVNVIGFDLDFLAGAVKSVADNDILHCDGSLRLGCCDGLSFGNVAHDNLLLDCLASFVGKGDKSDLTAIGCGGGWVKIIRNDLDLTRASLSVADGDLFSGRLRLLILGMQVQVLIIVDFRVDGLAGNWARTNRLQGKTSDGADRSIARSRLRVIHRLGLRSGVANDNFLHDLFTIIVSDGHVLDFAMIRGLSVHVKINRNDLDVTLLCVSIADSDLLRGRCRGLRIGSLGVNRLTGDRAVTCGLERLTSNRASRHNMLLGTDMRVGMNFGIGGSVMLMSGRSLGVNRLS